MPEPNSYAAPVTDPKIPKGEGGILTFNSFEKTNNVIIDHFNCCVANYTQKKIKRWFDRRDRYSFRCFRNDCCSSFLFKRRKFCFQITYAEGGMEVKLQ